VSILLVDPDTDWGPAIARRLVEEGDEVRVLTPRPSEWTDAPVYIAAGDPLDADLVERACTNVRTVVLTFPGRKVSLSQLQVVVDAAPKSGTDRVVVCTGQVDLALQESLETSGMAFVILVTGRRGFLPRTAVMPAEVAAAVSAADDLAGRPELVVDLTTDVGRKELRLV
jgi:hypothetical protein